MKTKKKLARELIDLHEHGSFIMFNKFGSGYDDITLDGTFSLDQLRHIVKVMEAIEQAPQ